MAGIVVNSAVQVCGSDSKLYDPKLNNMNQIRENNHTLSSRHSFFKILKLDRAFSKCLFPQGGCIGSPYLLNQNPVNLILKFLISAWLV
jgi:hypothetical protein